MHPWQFSWGGLFGHVKSAVIQKWCSILVQTHEILAGGDPWFWSTYIHTHDRLDKLRSALAEAQLKIHNLPNTRLCGLFFEWEPNRNNDASFLSEKNSYKEYLTIITYPCSTRRRLFVHTTHLMQSFYDLSRFSAIFLDVFQVLW